MSKEIYGDKLWEEIQDSWRRNEMRVGRAPYFNSWKDHNLHGFFVTVAIVTVILVGIVAS